MGLISWFKWQYYSSEFSYVFSGVQSINKLPNLFKSAKNNLSDSKISELKRRTLEFSSKVDVIIGIKICSFFLGEEQFDAQYIKLAKIAVRNNRQAEIDSKELRNVISNVTSVSFSEVLIPYSNYSKETFDLLVDTLVPFVDYFSEIKKEYYLIALTFYERGYHERANAVCEKLEGKSSSWLHLFLQLKNKELQSISKDDKVLSSYELTVKKLISTSVVLNNIADQEYSSFWENYVKTVIYVSSTSSSDRSVSLLSKVRGEVNSYCQAASTYSSMVNSLTDMLVKVLWFSAIDSETKKQFEKAIDLYGQVKKENQVVYSKRSEFRSALCTLKLQSGTIGKNAEQSILSLLDTHSYENLREDLAYRYAIYLIYCSRFSEAESVLLKYLPTETKLLSVCQNILVKESLDLLSDLNAKIEAMNEGKLDVNDAILLSRSFDSIAAKISKRLTDTSKVLSSYKERISNSILCTLFNEERYEEAFDEIKRQHPQFIQNDTAFRNIVIASIGLLENGSVDVHKVKEAISIWLSAVYTDSLFVKSLDYTSWDDPYTFTLWGSLGQSFDSDYDCLPDNVNFDKPEENINIAIRDVQNSLLNRLDKIIHDKYPSRIGFYEGEKSALEELLSINRAYSFIVASPYLAKNQADAFCSIAKVVNQAYVDCNSLESEFSSDDNESVLHVGLLYGIDESQYNSYRTAMSIAEDCCESLEGSLRSQKAAFAQIEKVKPYPKLFGKVKSAVASAIDSSIKSHEDFSDFLDKYEHICKVLNDKQSSYACVNYVLRKVGPFVSNNKLAIYRVVDYLIRIFILDKTNKEVRNMLVLALVKLEIKSEQTNAVSEYRRALSKAYSVLGNDFKQEVKEAILLFWLYKNYGKS